MKFLHLSVMSFVFILGIGYSGYLNAAPQKLHECGINAVEATYKGNQQQADDEFLYYEGYVYECDNKLCTDDTEIELPQGHVFKGTTINETVKYKCNVTAWGGDQWEVVSSTSGTFKEPGRQYTDKACPANLGTVRTAFMFQYSNDNEFIYAGNLVYECDNQQGCEKGKQITLAPGHKFKGEIINRTATYVCKTGGGDRWEEVKSGANTPPNKPNPNPNPVKPNPGAECVQSGGVWSNGACVCDAAKNLKVSGKVCVCLNDTEYIRAADGKSCIKLDPAKNDCLKPESAASGAYWDDQKGCLCRQQNYIWIGGKCVLNPEIAKCNSMPDMQWNTLLGECECINAGYIVVNGKCVKEDSAGTTISSEQSALTRIRNAISSADGVASSLEADKTVWRNEDGKFNTTRLASDSIAAVVLGTAGGLITSNVIKKNQVENGFEDISCTIGGQVVAGWGDEFSVGVK